MTIGVYALHWVVPDLVYIGQSNNIELRKYEHYRLMHNNKASNYKIQKAFNEYGEPDFHILEECKICDLDDIEQIYIAEFNSVKKGCNILPVPFGTGKDTEHSASKYTKETIIQVVDLLIADMPLAQIKELTRVSTSVISTILNQTRHTWISQDLKDLLELSKNRRILKSTIKSNPDYWIKCPKGSIYKVDNIAEFARTHKLLNTKLNEVLRYKRKSHCGWQRPTETELNNVLNKY